MSDKEAVVDSQDGKTVAPRSVLVADDNLYLTLLENSKSLKLLEDRNAMVVPYSLTPEVNLDEVLQVRRLLEQSGQVVRNALFVKNPYDIASYEPVEGAIQTFATAKIRAVGHVASLLGARSVQVVETRVGNTVVRQEGGLGVKVPALGANARASREVATDLAQRVRVEMKFVGGEPRPEEALDYLRRRHLSSDDELLSLIEMRAESRLQKYTITVNGTRESMANLTAALELAKAAPMKALDIGATFSQAVRSSSTVEMTTKITF